MPDITVRTTVDGLRIREQPETGKPIGTLHLDDIVVVLESVESTHAKLGAQGQWLHVRNPEGVSGYAAAWLLQPLDLPQAQDATVYVTTVVEGLRVRDAPSTDGKPIDQVYGLEALESLEDAATTLDKLGQPGAWLKIRTPEGFEGYTASWYLKVTDAPEPDSEPEPAPVPQPDPQPVDPQPQPEDRRTQLTNTRIMGVNLDTWHPLGQPDPARLGALGWVRFGYNVSMGRGSQDIQAAFDHYAPVAERYAQAGYKVLFAVTHQTYGEGVDEYWPWPNMTDQKWHRFTPRFTDMVERIAAQYAVEGTVAAWQIWNEQDAPIGAHASVPMLPNNYAHLLSETIRAIRSVDPDVALISGGHTGGPGDGAAYARATVRELAADTPLDGIAFHPYGRGTRLGSRYANWGHIDESLKAYTRILPDQPVWITEWGALDKEGDPPDALAQYMTEFVNYVADRYPDQVAALIWYAWAMGMHNGYGLVGRDDFPIMPLYERYVRLGV